VSYFSLPHVRRVASPSWVLDRRCGVTAGRAATRAAPLRAALAEAGPPSTGRALRTRVATRVAVGRARGPHQRREHGPHPCGRGPRMRCATGPSAVSAQSHSN
jgi:hypothetical protein